MDQEACFGPADDGTEDVNLSSIPTTPEEYFRQMRAERKKQPAVVAVRVPTTTKKTSTSSGKADDGCTSPEAKKQKWFTENGVIQEKRLGRETAPSLIPSPEWQRGKAAQFKEHRLKIAPLTADNQTSVERRKIADLKTQDEEKWREILFGKCLPEFENQLVNFPNHTGTPPCLPMVLSIPKKFLTQLIEYLATWAAEEGFNRPIREWLFAILVIIDEPLVQEAVSAIREIAKQCRNLRSQLSEDRKLEAYEYSLFITIVGVYFVQKDLSDCF
uniref:Gem-associated protein 2 n=1 Tax=Caenorhabditis japonica TaxID=281687 RepID=A0A8R1E4X4_CAEJA